MRGLKPKNWDFGITGFILLEMAFMVYFRKGILNNFVNEFGFFFSSLAIGFIVLRKYYGKPVAYVAKSAPGNSLKWFWPIPLSAIILLGIFVVALIPVFQKTPATIAYSDVIPTIHVAVERFLSSQTVYATITEFGYTLPLTYLPMQWLPYIAAAALKIDFRWVAIAIFFLSSIVILYRCFRVSPKISWLLLFLLSFTCWMLVVNDQGILTMTVELMVAGYYMLLIAGLSGKNPWLRGAVIALCLLSRYSLLLWLPLWAFVEFFGSNRKDFFRSCLTIALLVIGIYVIPFLSKDWTSFSQGYHYYTKAAMGAWHDGDGQSVPFVLNLGLGFAREFFVNLSNLPVDQRLFILQKTHIIVCLGSCLLLGIWYWKKRSKIPARIFLLGSFKIYLAFFLAFIQVPYPYLMITAAGVSIAILGELQRWQIVPEKASEF
ncbi:MAG: hypothetical protein ABI378_10980 [Chitinophagaceae bacterium]